MNNKPYQITEIERDPVSDDKELADRVVALGVGQQCGKGFYLLPESWDYSAIEGNECDAELFVNDPRVAMALMERVLDEGFVFDIGQKVRIVSTDIAIPINESLPRAITETCVEALS